jgi:hypothetical protein
MAQKGVFAMRWSFAIASKGLAYIEWPICLISLAYSANLHLLRSKAT